MKTCNSRALPTLVAAACCILAASCYSTDTSSTTAAFDVPPYVALIRQERATIQWICSTKERFTLEYGKESWQRRKPSRTNLDTDEGTRYLYRVRIEDLTPATTYRYRVKSAAGGKTIFSSSFTTLPAAGKTNGKIAFVVYGDSRDNPAAHAAITSLIAANTPLFILHTGDMTGHSSYRQWLEQFFIPLCTPRKEFPRGIIARTPIMPVRGNHENNPLLLKSLFDLPQGRTWYSFDCGALHVTVVDSCIGGEDKTAMLKWLGKDLARSKATWKLVAYHYPTLDASTSRVSWGKSDIAPLFHRHGVDIVFSGHVHSYQRFKPVYIPGVDEKKPVTYIVTGGGGAPFYKVPQHETHLASAMDFHAMFFTAWTDRKGKTPLHHLACIVKNAQGKIIDRFELKKRPSGDYLPDYTAKALPLQRVLDSLRPPTTPP